MLSSHLLKQASKNRRYASPNPRQSLGKNRPPQRRGRSQSLFFYDSDNSSDDSDSGNRRRSATTSKRRSKSPTIPSRSSPGRVVPAVTVTVDLSDSQRSKKELDKRGSESEMMSRRASLQAVGHFVNCECDDKKATKKKKVKIEVHPYTDDPTVAWEMMRTKNNVKLIRQMKIDSPIRKDAIRFVCISDTHSRYLDPALVPKGDVFLVAGDFTACGSPDEVKAFSKFLGKLPHSHKIVIAGNHEMSFDPNFRSGNFEKRLSAKEAALRKRLMDSLTKEKCSDPRNLLKNCVYLEDGLVEIFGITIFGTPWQPVFDNWAFNLPRGQSLLDKWNRIPTGIDVLVTHTPPLGHGDLLKNGVRAGCAELLNSVCKRIRPKYHVYGHIHEGYGCTTDGYTKFINACICDTKMQPTNAPVLFDIALPMGISKAAALLQPAKISRRNSSV